MCRVLLVSVTGTMTLLCVQWHVFQRTMCVCVCVCVCARARLRSSVRACVRACMLHEESARTRKHNHTDTLSNLEPALCALLSAD